MTSTTSPVSGAKRSDTAFTDSTTPKVFMLDSLAPTLGSSTNTTSPSCSWAKAVMPMRARSPSIFAHSCSLVYLRSPGTLDITPPYGFLALEGENGVRTTRARCPTLRISTSSSVPIAARSART